MKPSDFAWNKLNAVKREKPLGSLSPIVWVLEPSHGCNLKCGHCCAELVPRSDYKLMSREVWDSSFKILNEVSPTVRVDLCGMVGEPTLNPKLTEWLPSARRLAPRAQIQITTNGTMLLRGKVTFKGLLDAGANIVCADQYGDKRKFEQLASESGYPFYQYYDPPEGAWTPWQYWGPHVKMIVLMDPPDTWPKSRFRAGLLGNWYGNLNWEKGRKYAMKPLERPLTRRCNQPFLYVNVAASGGYLLCCQDGMQVTNGMFGSVLEGTDGFKKFWFGKELQLIRRRLRNKDRAGTPYACAKCNITFSRCDFKHWTDEEVSKFWNGSDWEEFPEEAAVDRAPSYFSRFSRKQ